MSFLQSVISDATPPRIMRKLTVSRAHQPIENSRDLATHSVNTGEISERGPDYHKTRPSVATAKRPKRRNVASVKQQMERQTSFTSVPGPAPVPVSETIESPADHKERQKPETVSWTSDRVPPSAEIPSRSSRFQAEKTRPKGSGSEQPLTHLQHAKEPSTSRKSAQHDPTTEQKQTVVSPPSDSADSAPTESARPRSHQVLDEKQMGDKAGYVKVKAGKEHGEISSTQPATIGQENILESALPHSTPHNERQTTAVIHTEPIPAERGGSKSNHHDDRDYFSAEQSEHFESSTTVYTQQPEPARSANPDHQKSKPGVPLKVVQKTYQEQHGLYHKLERHEEGSALFQQPQPISPAPQQDTPHVQIGQIDVFIEAPQTPESRSAPAPNSDFASRHFLRRL